MGQTSAIAKQTKFTPAQVGAQWGVPTDRVIAWIKAGELRAINGSLNPHSRKPRFLIDAADLAAFELKRQIGTSPVSQNTPRRSKQRGVNVISFY